MLQAQGAKASFLQTDITVETEVRRLFEQIMARYGRLDIAFNNAGHEGTRGTVNELSETDWDATINANLKGTWLSMKYEIQQMLAQGSGVIVNMAANLAYIGLPQMGAYSAAKAGILALTRVAALETIRSGVRINAVSPGPVGTPMAERLFGSLMLALLLLIAFVWIEVRVKEPLMRLALLRLRPLAAANLISLLAPGTYVAMLFLLTLYLQEVLGYSALLTGMALIPLELALALTINLIPISSLVSG